MTPDELKLITDLLPDAFILLSTSGSIRAANRAAHQLFRTDHLVGLALDDFVTDPPSKISDSIEQWTASPVWLPISFNMRAGGRGSSLLRGPSSSGRQHKRDSLDFGSLHSKAPNLGRRLSRSIEKRNRRVTEAADPAEGTRHTADHCSAHCCRGFCARNRQSPKCGVYVLATSSNGD